MIDEQQQAIDRQREQLEKKNLQLEALSKENKELTNFKESHKNAILNMLHEHMDVEKIAALLSCDISYVEQIKTEIK